MANSDEKTCPFCSETIKAQAVKCRYCGEFFERDAGQPITGTSASQSESPAETEILTRGEDSDAPFIYNGTLSRIALVGPAIVLFVWIVVAIAIGIVGVRSLANAGDAYAKYTNVPVLVGLAISILAILWFVAKWISFKSRVIRITQDRIETEQGIFSKRIENMDMWRVQDVSFHRTIIQGLFGVGSVTITSSDMSNPRMVIGPVPEARKLFGLLQTVQRKADRRQGVLHIEQ